MKKGLHVFCLYFHIMGLGERERERERVGGGGNMCGKGTRRERELLTSGISAHLINIMLSFFVYLFVCRDV